MKTVHSSHGDLICGEDGTVLEVRHSQGQGWINGVPIEKRDEDLDCLRDIARFDFDEYFAAYPGEGRADVNEFDILDLAYWNDKGERYPAEPDFRQNVAAKDTTRIRFVRDVDALVWLGSSGSLEERAFEKGEEVEVAHLHSSVDQWWASFPNGTRCPLQKEDVELLN